MDYQTAANQAVQLQQQANEVGQRLRALAETLQTRITDPALARELLLDLRETTLAIQQQNQSTLGLIQQMAQYIHVLESHLQAQQLQQPQQQPFMQPRGWASQPYPMAGGGFMGNVLTGLGLGAGFGLGDDLVNNIFGGW